MLDKIDVDGCTREEGTAQHGDKLRDFEHGLCSFSCANIAERTG
jgi:hypothetical protein